MSREELFLTLYTHSESLLSYVAVFHACSRYITHLYPVVQSGCDSNYSTFKNSAAAVYIHSCGRQNYRSTAHPQLGAVAHSAPC